MLGAKVGEIRLSQDSTVKTKTAKVALASLYEEYYDRIVRYIFIRINDQSEPKI